MKPKTNLSVYFPGKWKLTWTGEDTYPNKAVQVRGSEIVEIIDRKYFTDGKHVFNIIGVHTTNKDIEFVKQKLNRSLHSMECLTVSDNLISRMDSFGFKIVYERIKS